MDSTFREYNSTTTTTREVPRTIAESEMKREDILRMAKKAKFYVNANEAFSPLGYQDLELTKHLQRFAALVASAERKACAEMVDSYVGFVSELSDRILARGEE